MYIERDLAMNKVADFIKNVQPLLNGNKRADEVYCKTLKSLVIGWEISDFGGKNG